MGTQVEPRAQAEVGRPANTMDAEPHYSILLVEDDNVTLKAVEAILRIHGNYRVTTAMNVAQALQHVKDAKEKGEGMFDLVLTDLCLPEVSGLQLLHEIMDIPVVVMSCQDSQASVLQAFEAGAAGYLIKPIRKNEVSTLWQHIWRNNRGKVTTQMAASAAAATAGQGNDSGASASTAVPLTGNGTGQGSSDAMPPTATPNPASQMDAEQGSDDSDSGQPRGDAQACSSSHAGQASLHAHVQGAEIAAVQLDLPLALTRTAQADTCTTADAVTGEQPAAEALHCGTASPSGPAEGSSGPSGCSSGMDHSSGTCMTFAGACQSGSRAAQPLSRPLATGHDGHPGHLPPGLQELAGLGQQRRHEAGSQAPPLWQPHGQKQRQQQQQEQQQQEPQRQQQQQHASAEQDAKQEQEHMVSGLNHSCASAFTAVTVFLPRSGAAAAAPAAASGSHAPSTSAAGHHAASAPAHRQGSGQAPQQAAAAAASTSKTDFAEASTRPQQQPRQPPPSVTASCAPAPAEATASGPATAAAPPASAAMQASAALQASASALWPGATLPALQPLVTCGPTAAHQAQPTALSQVHYLPQSVIQLICALSASGGNGVVPVPTPHAHVSAIARTPSAQLADASQATKATHRQAAVAKYLEKRKIRSFQKKVRYESRKRLAESRPRVKGQFVKQSVLEAAKAFDAAVEQQLPAAVGTSGPHGVSKGSSETDAAEVLAALADGLPLTGKRARPEVEEEGESEDDAMSDTEP